MTIDQFICKWVLRDGYMFHPQTIERLNNVDIEMRADLEEMLKPLDRAKKYAKDYWDGNFMGQTQEQCDKAFEESWKREVVDVP